jgi:EAL domain-containing protein (putative c-di-GMP-specific phosphodiesterase class I)
MPADGDKLILPGTFLYDAERVGLVQTIDRWVLAQAVNLLHRYNSRGIEIVLTVNVSPKTLNDADVGQQLRELIADNPIQDGSLVIEITETAAIANIERARDRTRDLRALGCRIAIDDFGAGFTTFYYLKHLSFDYIKIDGQFIKHLPHTNIDQLVVRAVVDIARRLGAQTIAEFVQDDETLSMLKQLGVDYAQSDHTGQPGPLDIVLPPLEANSTIESAGKAGVRVSRIE